MAVLHFDVFIIGTGRSGRDVATACADAGKKVAVSDSREYGGTCANRGCDPKKVIVGLTEILQRAIDLKGFGINDVPGFSWEDLQKFKSGFTDAVPFVNERKLKEHGITLYHQSPKFIDKNTLSVEGKTVTFDKLVIATGQKPRILNFEGANFTLSSDDFLEMDHLPESIVFIGGGYIAMELAHISARLGVKTTIIHSHSLPLNNFEPKTVEYLVEASKKTGIQFIFNSRVNKIEKLRKNFRVYAQMADETITIDAEKVFNTAGRVPSIDELDLDKGDVEYTSKGIAVNQRLQNTKNKNVYACGDVSDSSMLPLTPSAPVEAKVVISQLIGNQSEKLETIPQPTSVFTIPQIAAIGLTEEEAKKTVKNFSVFSNDLNKWYNAKRINSEIYFYQLIINDEDKTIVGAHLIGDQVSESINIISLAMKNKITIEDLAGTMFTYPTWCHDIQAIAEFITKELKNKSR